MEVCFFMAIIVSIRIKFEHTNSTKNVRISIKYVRFQEIVLCNQAKLHDFGFKTEITGLEIRPLIILIIPCQITPKKSSAKENGIIEIIFKIKPNGRAHCFNGKMILGKIALIPRKTGRYFSFPALTITQGSHKKQRDY